MLSRVRFCAAIGFLSLIAVSATRFALAEESTAFKVGDLVATKQETPVQAAEGVIATLAAGDEVTVIGVKKDWVGISAEQNGQKVAGWVKPEMLEAVAANPAVDAFKRGYAEHVQGNLDQAVADYTEAIRLDPKYARAYNNRGLAYQAQRKINEAIADFTEAVTLKPTLSAAYLNRGIAYAAKRDYAKAIADYDEAIRYDPENYFAYKWRSGAYAARGETKTAAEDSITAMKYYKPRYDTVAHKAIRAELEVKGPNYVPNFEMLDSIMDEAKARIRTREKYAEGDIIAILQMIDAILTNRKFITVGQGLVCDALVPRQISKEMLKGIDPKGLRFRPRPGDTLFFAHPLVMCLLYESIGEVLGLPIQVQMTPGQPMVRWAVDDKSHINWDTSMGSVKTDQELIARGPISNAAFKNGVYLRALSADEALAYAYANLARVWMGEWLGLENEYAPAKPEDPAQASAIQKDLTSIGDDEKKKAEDRRSKAIDALTKAIEMNNRAYDIYLQRAAYWGLVEDHDKAVEDNSIAIRLNPDPIDPYLARGIAQLGRGDRQRAMNDFQKVIQMNPNLPAAYYFRGIVWAESRDFNHALEDLSRAIRMEPKFIGAYQVRAKVYDVLGQKDKAEADLRTAKGLQKR